MDDSLFFQRYKYKLQIDLIHWNQQENMERVPVHNIHFRETDFEKLYLQMHILWHNLLYESFLIYGTNPDNYRIINRWKNGYILAFQIPGQHEWIAIGQFYEKEHLIRMANLFWSFLHSIVSRCHPSYLIESQNGPDHMTIVFPRFHKAFLGKQRTESMLRHVLPVHLKLSFRWLPVREMQPFEKLYYAWRKAWADGQHEQIDILKQQLRTFLSRWDAGIK
ncbi:MAG: hypothetical protein LUH15_08675 [Tannerellaceae bacterium]|nr:hypothetical protein [Tannerellaceae bacterium]